MNNETQTTDATAPDRQMVAALSSWDGEGGAGPGGPQEGARNSDVRLTSQPLTNAELVLLRIRMIALENVVISLLANASERQLAQVREMAAYISPRAGFTLHPLTIHAGHQMIDLVERAYKFRRPDAVVGAQTISPSVPKPYKCTAIFDENTLPVGLRCEHRTKVGVWAVIRVLEGRVRYQILDPAFEVILGPGQPGLVAPDQPHTVEPLGPVKMQVEFYKMCPELSAQHH